jgi:type IV pilus assembly protein PilX
MNGLRKKQLNCQKISSNQSGAALVVALVVLSVVTVIGISNIQSTTLEMRMAASMVDRTKAFSHVEAALLYAENDLENGGWLNIDALYTDCALGSGCFDDVCTDGLCADVDYPSISDRYSCTVAPNSASVARTNYWQITDIWDDANRHRQTPDSAEFPVRVKYIYEFLCYIETTVATPDEGKPLFRITAYLEQGVESNAGDGNPWRSRSPVMIQSTYALPW